MSTAVLCMYVCLLLLTGIYMQVEGTLLVLIKEESVCDIDHEVEDEVTKSISISIYSNMTSSSI